MMGNSKESTVHIAHRREVRWGKLQFARSTQRDCIYQTTQILTREECNFCNQLHEQNPVSKADSLIAGQGFE
jgi:hypothetical protein